MIHALFALFLFAAPQSADTIADVRVHGNHLTPDARVIALSGLEVGQPFTPKTIADATRRLREAGIFDDIDVLKRFASIEDPSRILIMIVVNEGPVKIEMPDTPGVEPRMVKRGPLSRFMYFPVLDAEDGYGWRYGARIALARPVGRDSRLSFPLTWGGERRAGAELEHDFRQGRVILGGALTSRRNPAFDERDSRRRAWARAEGTLGRLHVGGEGGIERIHYADVIETVKHVGADAVLDTRLDPFLARNAVYARAGIERLYPEIRLGDGALYRTSLEARGYLGLLGLAVLVARVARDDASQPVQPYFKHLLGGVANLRGFEAGAFAGDTVVAGTLELRVPVTTPLSAAKFGVRAFADAGTAYDKGQRYRDQTLQQGYGGGVFLTAAAFHLTLDVAHGKGAGTRVHFGGGIGF
jgi:outer membrane protein assembly factor BamA